jgi:hypothetical protein
MRILRIRLKNYRGVDEHEVVLPPAGITVVEGDNEVGKSSLAEALDIVFEYPDSSTHKRIKAIKPVHRDEGAEIEVDVEAGPYRFTYMKRFHRKQATTLVVHSPTPESHTGREAHERAEAILEASVDMPLWRALRLQQGVAPDQADLSEQTSLAAALDAASAGALAGDREATVIDLAKAEFDRSFTPGRKLKADIADLERREADAAARVGDLRRRLDDLDHDVEHAAELVARIAALAEEAQEHRVRVEEYEQRWQSVDALLREVERARSAHDLAVMKLAAAEQAMAQRSGHAAAVDEAERALRHAQAKHSRHAPALAAAEHALAGAEAAGAKAAEQAEAADALVRRSQADLQVLNDNLHLEMLTERWQRVQTAEPRLAELDALLDATLIDAEAMATIEEAHLAAAEARARVEGEAASVAVEALAEVAVVVDGVPHLLGPGESVSAQASGAAAVEIGGVARVLVRGGREAGQSASALAAAESRLAEACAAAGVADIAEARAAAAQKIDAMRERQHLVDQLQNDLRDLTPARMANKIERLRARVGEGVAAEGPTDLDTARRMVEEAEEAAAESHDLRREAEEEVGRRRRALEVVKSQARLSENEVELANRQLVSLRTELESARATVCDADLAAAVQAASTEVEQAARLLATASGEADKARPDELRVTLANSKAVLDKLEAERHRAEQTHTEVRARLAVLGEQGLHDMLAEAEAELEHRGRERRAAQRRAAAARRLYETLERCRGQARRAYVAPLKAKIDAFGRIVFGDGFTAEVGEDLRIVSRTLDGVTVGFEHLSTGTREQLCVISRLACAAIVADDGGVPMVLDDALGWSDSKRLERLGAVLSLAARDAQVIVLTCMPERYRHVGSAHVVHLT